MNKFFSHVITLNIVFGLAYFALADLGFAWGALSASASLLWPPSGLALFALVVYGRRVMPGLLIGAIWSTLWLSLQHALGYNAYSLFIAVLLGGATIAQARLAARPSHQLVAQKLRVGLREALYFTLRILLCCTLSSTVSNLLLWQTGIIPLSSALQNWALWWVGDSIGMLIFGSLFIWIFKRKALRNNAQGNAFLIFCAGVGTILLAVASIGHDERTTAQKNLQYQATSLRATLQSQIDLASRDLDILRRYYAKNMLDREEFQYFAEPLLKRTEWLDNVTIVPFWSTTSSDGHITNSPDLSAALRYERNANNMLDWGSVATQVPAFQMPGLHGNATQLGDLRWRHLANADTPAHAGGASTPLIAMLAPVCINPMNGESVTTTATSPCVLRQMIAIDLNLDLWMQEAMRKLEQPALDIRLQLASGIALDWHGKHWTESIDSSNIYFKSPINVDGKTPQITVQNRQWQLLIAPTTIAPWLMPSLYQIAVFLIGISLVSFIAAYLQALHKNDVLIAGNQQRLETAIATQTSSLRTLIAELEKFKRFAEYSNQGFAIVNLRGELEYMNPWLQLKLEGNLTTSYTQKNFRLYYPVHLRQQFEDEIIPATFQHGLWEGELIGLHADGTQFITHETFFLIRDDEGKPVYIGDVVIDISERKQVQQAMQEAKDAAEEATQAKSRFLANMSHEIRTPLNAVLGYSQLLIADAHLSEQQRERLSAILNAGQRLLHLINDILDLSKIEAGALHLRHDYFDLGKELQDIILLMSAKANQKGLAFTPQISLPAPAIVQSDRHKLGQIILNLLGNAIKFTAAGQVEFKVYCDAHLVYFEVTDSGPGIASTELQALFSAFKQGKAGQDAGGTGLGLVIAKNIAEHMGGALILESEIGIGTRACLRLPLKFERGTVMPGAAAFSKPFAPQHQLQLAAGERCKVLIVEDDFASRDVLVHLLRNIGCEVVEAQDGHEGLRAISTEQPDIVFTDIRMPGLNGIEMLNLLRHTAGAEHLPVIAVSASSLEHERTFYLAQGFQEFIGKPYEFSDISDTLRRFSSARFDVSPNTLAAAALASVDVIEQIDWQASPQVKVLKQQLEALRSALNAGDMGISKKLFAQHSAEQLGARAYQQIHSAIRQYDLVLAEQYVGELLEAIAAAG